MASEDKAMLSKEAGNSHFKNKEYVLALKCYTQALQDCPQGHESKAVFLKNRAACYLKLEKYPSALTDCTEALLIKPHDPKTLYRRSLAFEGTGNLTDAFNDLKFLLTIEPKNKEALELARKLTTTIKKQQEVLQSTDGIIKEMFEALADPKLPEAKVIMAAKNCAILSHERAGAERIYQAGGVAILLPLLELGLPEVSHYVLETFAGLCTGHKARAYVVIQTISLEVISMLINHEKSQVSCSAVAVIKQALLSVSSEDQVTPKNPDLAVVVSADTALIMPVIQMVFLLLLKKSVRSVARDSIMEMLVSTIPKNKFVVSVYYKGGLVFKLLELSVISEEEGDGVSDECRSNISVVLSTLYQHSSDEEKLGMEKECTAFVLARLGRNDVMSKREAITVIATLLHGVLEIGAKIFMLQSSKDEVLKMADSADVQSQGVAAEALALAASNKERCHGIMSDGLPVLKKLFSSQEDAVKVRALVGLCKLGCMGGSNVNARTFPEGSGLKLEKACRKFLISAKKHSRLYKWAVEGLAFLSLDAEVKEAMISNKNTVKVLCDIPKTGEQSLLYGISSIFVNLTNSYDKAEKNPDLEELGKYAGENMPKEHELDGEEFVKKRVSSLLHQGVVSSLIILGEVESNAIHEQVARVFLALVGEVSNRGVVVQQGGVRMLLPLTNSNTSNGKLIASQALAKIGITNDPRLAFPGQRALEVIRPLVQLLKSEQGLQQFESLMALTNLGGLTDDVRQRIIKEGGIPLMESLMFEENDLIRRAATEALCNMIQMQEVHERFLKDDVERVKLWVLFSGEEDCALARAASGGLAQLTHDPRICSKVMEVKSTSDIVKELIASDNEELRHRGVFILANLMEASKDIAESITSSDFLEILMALVQAPTTSQLIKNSAKRALEKALEYKLIQPNPQID